MLAMLFSEAFEVMTSICFTSLAGQNKFMYVVYSLSQQINASLLQEIQQKNIYDHGHCCIHPEI